MNTHGGATYSPHYLAFIDILGFAQLVDETADDPTRVEFVRSVLHRIGSKTSSVVLATSEEEDREVYHELTKLTGRTFAFSDTVILSSEKRPLGLDWLLTSVIDLCTSLLISGIYTRGGITVGALYHDDFLVFGPALLEAYDLERSKAYYPRVIASEPFYAETKDWSAHTPSSFAKYAPDPLFLRYDRHPFLNIIDLLPLPFAYGGQLSPRTRDGWLGLVRQTTVRALGAQDDPRIQSKYIWFATYFNSVVAKYPKLGISEIPLP